MARYYISTGYGFFELKSIYRAVVDPHEVDVRAFGDTEPLLGIYLGCLLGFFLFFLSFVSR